MRPRRHKPRVEALEPRILYAADGAALAATLLPGADAAGTRDERLLASADAQTAGTAQADALAALALDGPMVSPTPGLRLSSTAAQGDTAAVTTDTSDTLATPGRTLVFVDARVQDWQTLAAGLPADAEVLRLDGASDGLAQISAALAGRQDVAALHIVSHGAEGLLLLGQGVIDRDSLARRADELGGWATALREDADILLYGCDVAAGTEGEALVRELAHLTRADVAASDDTTGAAARGGDALLEFRVGAVEAPLLFGSAAIDAWAGSLNTYVVTSSADSGLNTLRQAILDANANAGADSIIFSGVSTINLASLLPQITGQVSINGTVSGAPGVTINGGGTVTTGLHLVAGSDGSEIRGLVVQNFSSRGIYVVGASNVTIAGNYVGIDANGNFSVGNNVGIDLFDAANARIGGTTAADRNVVSGNTNIGINIVGSGGAGSAGTVVSGNYIGTNAAGTGDLGNANHGIYVNATSGVTIGGSASGAGNLVSGQNFSGVTLGATATAVSVQGNWIGLNVNGNGTIANSNYGIWILGADNTVGGTTSGARNVISGNGQLGIRLSGASATGNTIAGNYIGTATNGTTDLGNTEDGIQLDTGASNNTIGGTSTAARNIIGGNNNAGIALDDVATTGNIILGNWIGAGADGATQVANSHNGINVNGATGTQIGDGTAAGRNVIAGNSQRGIGINNASGTVIKGNWIVYNAFDGIVLNGATPGTVIGDTTGAGGNLIAHNSTDGILVWDANTSATILANSIYANGQRGIDLADNGYDNNDAGDADSGPNGLQNYPVLTSASAASDGTTVVGTLNGAAGTSYRIDIYTNRPGDVDGTHGEGARWLGSFTVTTDGSGNASINHLLMGAWINQGDRVTATATLDLGGGSYGVTSEFAANITGTASGVVVVDTSSDTADGITTSIANLGNNRGGDGRISLREAITATNATANGASPDRIVFAIPPDLESLNYNTAALPPTITLNSSLATITQAVNIDASTQAGFDGTPLVQLRGNGTVANGLTLAAGSTGSTVRGFIIGNFTANGINITGGNTHTIAGNWIGLARDGQTADANGQRGIVLGNSTGTTIGGTSSVDRNVISANTLGNLYLDNAVNNIVYGNYIGTDATGLLDPDGNSYVSGRSGIYLDGASTGNQIGNTIAGARNVISGNNWVGVDIISATATNNTISGNYIGTDATGLAALANGGGVGFWGGGAGNKAVANVISGNAGAGVGVGNGATGAVIQGNVIGLGADGSTALGNGTEGIVVYSGATGTVIGTDADGNNDAAERNVIAANTIGILVSDAGTGNVQIKGNYIGTDSTGMLARGNTNDGIALLGGTSNVTIGGVTAVERNVISGNATEGLFIDGNSVTVQGNYVGLNAAGTAALANGNYGINASVNATNVTVGGAATGAGNVISGNGNAGILFEAGSTGSIKGNRIGTDAAGTATIGGNGAGIWVGSSQVQVGGTASGEGNTVTGSNVQGIVVAGSGSGNALLGNLVYGNAELGIDLGDDGVTTNDAGDADSGVNGLQNFPVLTTARTNASNQIVLTGTINSAANSYYRIEFFANTSQDGTGYGEGQTYLGFANVATDGSGNATISTTLTANVALGSFISATATRATDNTYTAFNDTSEFSRNVAAIATTNPALVVDTTADTLDGDATSISTLLANKGADGFISLREAITAANNTANTGAADVIEFDIAGALVNGAHTITLLSDLPTLDEAVVIDGSSEPDFAGSPVVQLTDGGASTFLGLTLAGDGSTVRGLSITGFNTAGLLVQGNNNLVAGNWIGMAPDGSATAQYNYHGIIIDGSGNLVGGSSAADRNVIGYTDYSGITLNGGGAINNRISGNFIGLLADGSTPATMWNYAIGLFNGANGNVIGTNGDGVGDAGEGNVIGGGWTSLGNGGLTTLTVAGNRFGLDANGAVSAGGGGYLEVTNGTTVRIGSNGDGSSDALEANVFAGPLVITGDVSDLSIAGNYIGVATDGSTALGNASAGIVVSGNAIGTIGGASAAMANTIAYNGGDGIEVTGSSASVRILRNAIHDNAGLGIDLGGDGVTANDAGDADSGANTLQNAPVLALARTDGSGQVVITGSIESAANSHYRIEFFASTGADASGFGEGQTYLGFVNMNTGPSGPASFNRTLAATVPVGAVITATATATDATFTVYGATSEFSAQVEATVPNAAPQGRDALVATLVDTPYTFSAADFGFSDADGSALLRVWIDTLPATGTLSVFGTPVSAGSSVGLAELNAGWLTYQPPAGTTATESFTFRVQDDGGTALGGSDTDASANTMTVRTAASINAPEGLIALPGVPAAGVTGVYGFNRNADLGHDDANNGVDITLAGSPAQTPGPSGGGALYLAGGASGQYGDIAGITTGGAMTLAGWVRFDTTDSWQRVLDFGQANSGGIGNIYVGREGATSNLTFTIETNAGSLVTHRATATGAITDGQWLHFVATVDAAGSMNLYVDGGLADTHAGMVVAEGVRDHHYIGRSNWAPDRPFVGAVDDVVVIRGALTAEQAAALYRQDGRLGVTEGAANGTVVATLRPFDLDNGDTFTYSLTDSAGGRFAIDASGVLSVADGSRLDFEAARSHGVTVRATDSTGLWFEQALTIELADVANAPLLNVPAAQGTTEDTALVFSVAGGNAITLGNSDSTGALNELTLSVDRGTLTLAGTTGLTFASGDGSADATMTLRGTLADINAALDGLAWQPAADDTTGATLSLSAPDASLVRLNLDSALQGRYTFDGSGADQGPGTAQDATLLNGATYVVDGTRGQVLALDGVDDHVQITGTFGNPNEVTIGGWVNLAAGSGRREFISLDNRVHIALDDAGIGVKGSVQIGPTSWVDLVSNQFIAGTGWHHVMYSFSDSADSHALYIDGVLVASATITDSVDWAGAGNTTIGRHPSLGLYPQARVDDVRIFDRVLDATDVAALAQDQTLLAQASVALAVSAVNDAPVFTGLDGAPSFTEGDGPVVLDADVTVADAELGALDNFDGATLALQRAGLNSSQDVFSATGTLGALTEGGSLTVGGVTIGSVALNSNGMLRLDFNANATGALVNQAMQQIAYRNINGAPTGNADITWTFDDGNSGAQGSGGALSTVGHTVVTVQGVNDAPFFQSLNGTPTHTEGGAAVVLDANVAAFDFELGSANNFAGAIVTLQRQGGASADDRFEASGTLGALVEGSALTVGGVTIGSVVANSGGVLQLSFDSGANQTRIDAALRQIAYANASDAPPASVTIGWTLDDGNTGGQGLGGALTGSGSTTVTITAVNDAPTLNTTLSDLAYSEGDGAVAVDPGLVLADLDNTTLAGATITIQAPSYVAGQDSLAFTDQNGISGSWNAGTGTLTLTGSASLADYQAALRSVTYANGSDAPDTQARTVVFSISDGSASSIDASRDLLVTGVNDAPTATITPASYAVTEGALLALHGSGLVIADADAGSATVSATLSVDYGVLSAGAGTTGVTVSGNNSATLTFSGTLAQINNLLAGNLASFLRYTTSDDAPPASATLTLAVDDLGASGSGGALTGADTATIAITPVNDAPSSANRSVLITEDTPYTLQRSDFPFADSEGDAFTTLWIVTAPSSGALQLDGVALGAGDSVATSAIDAGRLVYLPAADLAGNAAASFAFRVQDDGGTASGGQDTSSAAATMSFDILGVNDAPTVQVPGLQVTAADTPLVLSSALGRALSMADLDAGSGTVRASLTASHGLLSLNGTTGLVFLSGDGSADATMSFIGSIAAINTALDGLVFTPGAGFQGAASLQFDVSDLGGSGSGGALLASATLPIQVGAQRFQEGVDGYSGTEDTWVQGSAPGTSHGNDATVVADDNAAGEAALLRFDNLFGAAPGQIPFGSTIGSVTLSLYVTNRDAADTVTLHRVQLPWSEASTFASLVGGVQADGSDALAAPELTIDAGLAGWINLSSAQLTASVQAWADGGANLGWAFVSQSADGWAFASSEAADSALRPYLSINFTPPQAPVVQTTAGTTATSEGAAATAVDAGLTLSDVDSSTLTGATVRITTGYASGQDRLAFTDQAGITGSWNATNGTLTLSGSASLAAYQAALRSVGFANDNDTPSTALRTVSFSVTDPTGLDSLAATRDLSVSAVNDAPVLAGGVSLTMVENATRLPFATTFTVSDADSADFSGGTLVASVGAGMQANDALFLSGGGFAGIDIIGSDVRSGGQVIGTWSRSPDRTVLTVSFNALADAADVQAVGRNVTFFHDSDTPALGVRTIDIVVSDGDGGTSNTASGSVDLDTAINDAPLISGRVSMAGTEDTVFAFTGLNTLQLSDADHQGGVMRLQLGVDAAATLSLGSSAGLSFLSGDGSADATIVVTGTLADLNAALATLTLTPAADDNGVVTLTLEIDDLGNSGTDPGTSGSATSEADTHVVALTLAAVNDAPLLSAGPGLATHVEDGAAVAVDPAIAVSEVDGDAITTATVRISAGYLDGEDRLEFTDQGGISGAWDALTGTLTLSGNASAAAYTAALRSVSYRNISHTPDTTTRSLEIQVGDGSLASGVVTRQVAVVAANDAPTGAVTIDGSATEDQTLSANTTALGDADGLGAFSYQWVRDGLDVAGANGASYTLGDADVGSTIGVRVSYTDGQGTVETLNSATVGPVSNVNDAPTGAVTIDGSATEDQTLSANTAALADIDGLGPFSYQWVRDGVDVAGANGATFTLGDADVGASIGVRVSYTDGQGTVETLTGAAVGPIANVNDAPTGAVSIDGSATEDQILSANTGALADIDGLGAFSYQWVRGGVDIAGANGATYTLGDADVGTSIGVRVSYTDGQGTVETLTGAAVGPVANVNDAPTGAVTVDGSATEDQTLSANTGALADIDGLGALSYQWVRNGIDVAGATGATYTLGDADVGATIGVRVSYTDGQGTVETLTGAAVGPVANVNDAPTGAVTVDGSATEDQTLSANTGAIADIDGLGAVSYQWVRNGVDMAGATGATYLLGDADVGASIGVRVSYTDGQGTVETLNSAAVGPVGNVNDAPTGVVTIDGSAIEDQTLSANTGAIADNDGLGAFSYQWVRNGVDVAGATGATYTLGDADVGSTIGVRVSYTDGQGTVETLTGAAVGPVANVNDAPTGAVTIDGNATEDQTLSANTAALADIDGLGAFSHQWVRNGVDIAGATGTTYTLGDADVGATIGVRVSYTDGQGRVETLNSAAVGPIANVNDAPTGAVTIDGSATEDQILSANTGALADIDGLGAFSYQWVRNGVDVAGANGATYTLGDADVGSTIGVRVSYTDGQGTLETLSGGSVGPVGNVNDAPTGAVTIDGSVTEDQTLSANTAVLADADGLGVFSYQWQRGGVDIAGATGATYTLGDADVGTSIGVRVRYTDGQGTVETLSSAVVGPVGNVNDAPTGIVTIDGSAIEDQTLSANTGALADIDGLGVFSYQWQRNGADIAGATGSTYALGDADVGASIGVRVSYTDGQGTVETLTGSAVGPVANINDAPTGAVTIHGTATEDQTLSANTGAIADNDGLGAFSYQWVRNGVDVAGASGATYLLGDADVGATIGVRVSYTDGQGTVETLTGAAIGPVANVNDAPNGAVTIDGNATEDQTLSANTSTLADIDGLGALSHQWQRNGVDIAGATGTTYTLGDADVGATIGVRVRYTDGQGTVETLNSAAVGPVGNVNDAPTGAVTIDGSATEDQTLSANTGAIADNDGLGAFSYQWVRNGVDVAGANGATYTLGDADVGSTIGVRVSYTDGQGTLETLSGGSVGPVGNVNDAPTGAVTIDGSVTEDQTLVANTAALADADGLGAFSYQWQRDGVDVAGATGATYTLGDADVGSTIGLRVQYTDGQGGAESLAGAPVGPVANLNDAPVFTVPSPAPQPPLAVDEGATAVIRLQASDIDNPPAALGFAIVGGADAARFVVDAATGELRFAAAPDFEAPGDADGDNRYELEVAVSDGSAVTRTTLQVDVGDVGEAPVLSVPASVHVAEGGSSVLALSASDPDAATTLTWRLVGGTDQAMFQVDAASGALRFVTTPDREAPQDADGDNRYEVEVEASDGQFAARQAMSVMVDDVNEAPVVAQALAPQTFSANQPLSFSLPADTFVDVDAGDQISLTVTNAPQWLSFDPVTRTFSGTAPQGTSGNLSIALRATDLAGAWVDETLELRLAAAPAPDTTRPDDTGSVDHGDAGPNRPAPPTTDTGGDTGAPVTPPTGLSDGAAERTPTPSAPPAEDDATDDPSLPRSTEREAATVVRADLASAVQQSSANRLRGPANAWSGNGFDPRLLVSDEATAGEAGLMKTLLPVLPEGGLGARGDEAAQGTTDRLLAKLGDPTVQAQTAVAAVSAGFVWWALRAGGLLASLLASTPLWRHFDPIPILGRGSREEDDEDDTEPADPGRDSGLDTRTGRAEWARDEAASRELMDEARRAPRDTR